MSRLVSMWRSWFCLFNVEVYFAVHIMNEIEALVNKRYPLLALDRRTALSLTTQARCWRVIYRQRQAGLGCGPWQTRSLQLSDRLGTAVSSKAHFTVGRIEQRYYNERQQSTMCCKRMRYTSVRQKNIGTDLKATWGESSLGQVTSTCMETTRCCTSWTSTFNSIVIV